MISFLLDILRTRYNILIINSLLEYIILAIQAPRQQHATAQQNLNLEPVETMAGINVQIFSLFFQHRKKLMLWPVLGCVHLAGNGEPEQILPGMLVWFI